MGLPTIPVVIVGAGPVGLALAGDLGWRGIECLVAEASDGSIYQPRMDLVGPRTMEFCRRWGIVDAVEATPYPRDYPQDNIYLTAMTGYELGREAMPSMNDSKPGAESPQTRERCPQNMFDPVLRAFAESQKTVSLRYLTRMRAFEELADGVLVDLENVKTGERSQLKTGYLLACDGGHSQVREALGIAMEGEGTLTYTTNIIFRCADFNSLHDKAAGYRHIFVGPKGTWATIVAINGRDEWRMSIVSQGKRRELTREELDAAIVRAMGKPFDYEILSVMPWTRRELVACSYGRGRVYLAGDAVHVMSPTGGFGMNTGICDAVDLSWKVAATIEGWGGDALLASYAVERRPVAVRNVKEASRNLRRMLSPGDNPALLDATPQGADVRRKVGNEFSQAMSHEWHTQGIHLGYRYIGSPIIVYDAQSSTMVDDPRCYVASSAAGARAPHVWLRDGRSTLDLFGKGFVLLAIGADAPQTGALEEAARQRGVPMKVVRLDEPAVVDLYSCALVLVRPDGHVAWRGDRMPASALDLIDIVRGAGAAVTTGTLSAVAGVAAQ